MHTVHDASLRRITEPSSWMQQQQQKLYCMHRCLICMKVARAHLFSVHLLSIPEGWSERCSQIHTTTIPYCFRQPSSSWPWKVQTTCHLPNVPVGRMLTMGMLMDFVATWPSWAVPPAAPTVAAAAPHPNEITPTTSITAIHCFVGSQWSDTNNRNLSRSLLCRLKFLKNVLIRKAHHEINSSSPGCAHILDAPKSIMHDQNDPGTTEGQHENGAAGSAGQDELGQLSYERCKREGQERSCMFS